MGFGLEVYGLWFAVYLEQVHDCVYKGAVEGLDDMLQQCSGLGFGVWGLGFGVWGLGFGV